MIQSASILPLVEEIDWGRAIPPGDRLTPVDLPSPVDVASYRRRDQELAYRDLVVAALLSEVVIQVGDVWQFQARRPQMPAAPVGSLAYSVYDSATVAAPGLVAHVLSSSVPKDAIPADQGLYARDLVLHESLRRAAAVLQDNPVQPIVPGMPPGEAWSLAEGARRVLASAGFNLPLDVSLFKHPDQDLADRDNQIAVFVAQIQDALSDVFSRAGRLLVKPPGQEPEVYALTSETDLERVWSAFPLLPDGRLRVRYDRRRRTVTWLGEEPVAANPAAQATTFQVAGGEATVIGAVPAQPDSEFYRQKASRLHTRPYSDRIIFQTTAPELYLTGGGIYQPSAVLLPVPGQLLFSLPIVIPAGCARIGLHIGPSKRISVLGFLNRTRQADGTAVTLASAGSVAFDVPLPVGRIVMQMDITDKTGRTPAFDVEITANGSQIFDGAFTFNSAAGSTVTTQPFELDNSGADGPGPVAIVVTWAGGAGQLTINSLSFLAPVPAPEIVYSLSLQVGPNQPTSPVQLMGVLERQDVVWFDTLVPESIANPVLGVSYAGGANAALYVHSYDVRVFDLKAALPDSAGYEPHKAALAGMALNCAQRAWIRALRTSPQDPRADADGAAAWDAPANLRWLTLVESQEPRLLQAFDAAGPGDIGRPAFIPDGLELATDGSTVLAPLPPERLRPTLRALQPWMLGFGPRVAGPDFWPQSEAGCASSGSLSSITVTADFDWALTLPSTGVGYVTFLSAVSRLAGSPDGSSFSAYTIVNAGPAGGVVRQTVALMAGLANLNVGATYSLTLSLRRQLVGGGTETTYTVVIPIAATASSMTVGLPEIIAPDGYEVRVQSAVLS